MQLIDFIETYAYGVSKDLVNKKLKERRKYMQQCNKTMQKMIKFVDVTKENIKEHNLD